MLFLTGASGYVGMRIGERLAGRNRRLRCLVLPGDPVDPGNRFPAQVVRGDLRDLDSFAAYGEGVNAIVHAAAVTPPGSPASMRDVNIGGTANMIAVARRWNVRRFLFFSVGSAPAGDDAHATSRREAERLVVGSGLDYTILRLAMVYGPGGSRAFRDLVSRVRRIPLVHPIPGRGASRLQPVYVGDVVRAVELVLGAAASRGKTYDVTGGTAVTLGDLVDRIAAAEGLRRRRIHVPMALCRATAGALSVALPSSLFSRDALLGFPDDAGLDHAPLREDCGYEPLTLEQGFARVFGGGESVR